MASSDKVFDILELIRLIADELSQRDLFFCCLVNKTFLQAFIQHLWHSITIRRQDPVPKFQTPEGRAGLLRNGHHIRVLRAYNPNALEPFVKFGTTCVNLVSLDVTHSTDYYKGLSSVYRPPEMLSKGRRKKLIDAGQKQISCPSKSGVATSTAGSGMFSTAAAASTGLPDSSEPTSSGLVETPTSTDSRQLGASSSTAVEFIAPITSEHSYAEWERDGETYLISVLERNSQLQFLVVPSHCVDSEPIVKIAGESLLSLKEFYSDTDHRQQKSNICFSLKMYSTRTSTNSIVGGQEAVAKVKGYLQCTGGELSHSVLNNYPRLRDMQINIFVRANNDALDRIRFADKRLAYLKITEGRSSQVAQILTLTPPLKRLSLRGYDLNADLQSAYAYHDNMIKADFLQHAPTLEHLEIATCYFPPEILHALLCSAPSLRTFKTREDDDYGCQPCEEAELDALQIIDGLWSCKKLKVFECKILNVPRPDVVDTPFTDNVNLVLPPGPPLGPAAAQDQSPLTDAMLVAQQESHAVQRQVLRQLGRLTRLRVLCLGKYGLSWNDAEYSRLEIRGIRTMVVDAYTDRNCLELSLASGLDELAGLRRLEELIVNQMAHRIGLAEVQWMVEHWPRLKSIAGLQYRVCDDEVDYGDDVGDFGSLEESEPEHVRWLRENRPDIALS